MLTWLLFRSVRYTCGDRGDQGLTWFFLFKQKTAYEVRISDWRSDVCSSDLGDDLARVAAGTIMGHLLECSAQVTGGYFAGPGKKDVPRLAELPYPYADLYSNGELFIGKPDGSGGRLDRMT